MEQNIDMKKDSCIRKRQGSVLAKFPKRKEKLFAPMKAHWLCTGPEIPRVEKELYEML